MTPQEKQAMQDQIDQLKRDLDSLKSTFFLNNFQSSQDFNKTSRFNTRLKVPHYTSDPTTAEVGEIIEVGGKLKICFTANTFTVVGTQT